MPFSSFILGVGSLLLSSTALATKYQQEESYTGKNWLDAFKFETYDLNNGFVNYLNEEDAKRERLYSVSGDDVLFGVDSTETLDHTKGPGRKSVRLEGKKNYNKGLFILDVKRMPGVCGMWPAFWSLGQEPWPVKGEIDIIEGVNDNKVNKYVLHIDTNCKVDGLGQSNPQAGRDCALNTAGSAGCDVNEVRSNSFGPGFNANNGGHYVMEWDSDAIKTWFFPRGSSLPRSLTSHNPDTSEFGTPAANFKGDCNIDQRFKDQRFIFTNNFCGDWAGNAYANSGCPMQEDDVTGATLSPMESCKKYVAKNPKAFEGQYWQIGSFKTFNKRSVSSSSSVHPSSTPASSSSIHSSTPVSSSSVHSSTLVSSSSVHSSTLVSSSSVHSSTPVSSSFSPVVSSASSHVVNSASSHVVNSASSHVVNSASSHVVNSASSHVVASSTIVSSASSPIVSSASSSSHISSSSSSAPVHYYGNFSAPISYSVPGYKSSATLPVYGDNAKSTPCTTSSANGAFSTTPAYPIYPNSAPNYGDYPSYPVSSPVKNDYPYLPSFTPVLPVYPPTTSKATYNDYYQPPFSNTTITTTYTTTYVDVCETGYITKTTTFAVTYCPTATPTPGEPRNPPTYGWDTKTTVCNKGCGEGPKTVTVTVPCTKCDYVKSTPTPAIPNKPNCNGYDCNGTASTTTTKIITLIKIPVPEATKSSPPVYGSDKPSSKPYEAPKSTPAKPVSSPVVSKPVVPASSPVINKPLVSTGTPGKPSTNGTISISVGTGVKPTPSRTGYAPPVFTGAAAGLQAGEFVAMVGVVAAMVLWGP